MSLPQKLPLSFYTQDTIQVSREILGKKLVHRLPSGHTLSGYITESEAYLGTEDSSCHTYRGRRTPRNEVMYQKGGCAYVYFTYGMHFCLNVVTSQKEIPEAVLIRGVKPLEGLEILRENRNFTPDKNLTNGPGKICQAFQIDRSLNGQPLLGNTLYLEEGLPIEEKDIHSSERVGLSGHLDAVFWPLRFFIKEP